MAVVEPASYLKNIRGKVCKAEKHVYSVRYGRNHLWDCNGVHTFNAAQIQVQTYMSQAAAQAATVMASSTQKATYMASFKAQTKYKTFRGYLMANLFSQIKNSTAD